VATRAPAIRAGGNFRQRVELTGDACFGNREGLKPERIIPIGPAVAELGHGGGRAETIGDPINDHWRSAAMDMTAEHVGHARPLVGFDQSLARGGVHREIPSMILVGLGDIVGAFVDVVDEERIMIQHHVMARLGQPGELLQPAIQFRGRGQGTVLDDFVAATEPDILVHQGPGERPDAIFESLEQLFRNITGDIVTVGQCTLPVRDLVAGVHVAGDDMPGHADGINDFAAELELLGLGIAVPGQIAADQHQVRLDPLDLFGGGAPVVVPTGFVAVGVGGADVDVGDMDKSPGSVFFGHTYRTDQPPIRGSSFRLVAIKA
jgi:hypothetical protein